MFAEHMSLIKGNVFFAKQENKIILTVKRRYFTIYIILSSNIIDCGTGQIKAVTSEKTSNYRT